MFWPNFLRPSQNFSENRLIEAFLGIFWKILTKKIAFFGARFPLKISKYGHRRLLVLNLGSASHKWVSQNSTKGSAGGRIFEEKTCQPPPPPPPPPIRYWLQPLQNVNFDLRVKSTNLLVVNKSSWKLILHISMFKSNWQLIPFRTVIVKQMFESVMWPSWSGEINKKIESVNYWPTKCSKIIICYCFYLQRWRFCSRHHMGRLLSRSSLSNLVDHHYLILIMGFFQMNLMMFDWSCLVIKWLQSGLRVQCHRKALVDTTSLHQ